MVSNTAPITRAGRSYSDQAEEALRRQIISGHRHPGERLNEVEVAAELGVSRGPIREAMQRLARDGLVHIEAHRGAFVRALDATEITGLFEVRISLECTAAEFAAKRRTDQDIARIHTLLDSTTVEVNRQPSPHYPTDLDLHQLIAFASGNAKLYRLIVQINQELMLGRATSGFHSDRAPIALIEHTAIVAAINRRDAPAARELMAEHLRHSLANTLRIVETIRDARTGESPDGR